MAAKRRTPRPTTSRTPPKRLGRGAGRGHGLWNGQHICRGERHGVEIVETKLSRLPPVLRLLDAFNRRVRSALAARIAEHRGTAVGSPEMTADLLLVIVLGLAHLDTLAPERRDRPAFRATVEAAVERILG